MPGLKQLRQRITTVRSTQKMTRAMHLVATTRLRGARAAIEATRPYAKGLDELMAQICARAPAIAERVPLLAGRGRENVHLLVAFTTDRGLCGGLNVGVVKLVKQRIARLEANGQQARLLCIGRKGRRLLEREHGKRIVATIEHGHFHRIGFQHAVPIADRILAMFAAGEFDVCCQIYARFRSILHQPPQSQQLIPTRYAVTTTAAEADGYRLKGMPAPFYEPDEAAVLERLLPHHVTTQVYRALLECAASEEGARVAATDRATRNAGELIRKLSITYNRQRQAAITREITEIVAGVEAQRGR
jgi:F-type H+-transporting ATPase subunit gamma